MHPTRIAILEYVRGCEHSPSLREIAQAVGVWHTTVRDHLLALERDGLIEFRGPRRHVHAVKQP